MSSPTVVSSLAAVAAGGLSRRVLPQAGLVAAQVRLLRTSRRTPAGGRSFSSSAAAAASPSSSSRHLLFVPSSLVISRGLSKSASASQQQEQPPSLADQVLSAKQQDEKSKREDGKEGHEGEEDPSQEKKKKGPRPISKWQRYGYYFFGVTFFSGGLVSAVAFSLPERDEKTGELIEDEYSGLPFYSQYPRRLKNRIFQTRKELIEPFSDHLLPDPLPEPYVQPKYTVLIELTGLLVHADWTHKYGWRFQKRPGVDMFLSQVGYPNFELVVYTTENSMTFYPIVTGLDESGQHIMYRLFRDATRYVNGVHTKDLKAINRDLRKVILVDWNKDSAALCLDNTLLLKKWEGDNADKTLIGLAQLLQAIRQSDVDDVREVLSYYKQFEDPIEAFRENQRKLQSEMELDEKRKEAEKSQKSVLSRFSGFSRQ